MADFVEKVGVSTQPNFFSAVGAILRCGRGGPHDPPQNQWSDDLNRRVNVFWFHIRKRPRFWKVSFSRGVIGWMQYNAVMDG